MEVLLWKGARVPSQTEMPNKCLPISYFYPGGSGWLWASLSGSQKGYGRDCGPQEDEQETFTEIERGKDKLKVVYYYLETYSLLEMYF
jgi:hypothetical protein